MSNHPLVLHIQSSSKTPNNKHVKSMTAYPQATSLTVSHTHSHSLTGFKVPLAPDQHHGPRTRARRGCGLWRWTMEYPAMCDSGHATGQTERRIDSIIGPRARPKRSYVSRYSLAASSNEKHSCLGIRLLDGDCQSLFASPRSPMPREHERGVPSGIIHIAAQPKRDYCRTGFFILAWRSMVMSNV